VHCVVERQRNPRTFHGPQAAVPATAALLCSILLGLDIHLDARIHKDEINNTQL